MEPEDRLTLDQVAVQVGVHYQTVYRWVRAGKLPAAKIEGSYVVRGDELHEFIHRRRQPTAPPAPTRPRIARQRQAMAEALLEGDETRVRSIARQLLSNGTTVTALIEDVIVPPLADIGASWHDGDLAIYVEHRASGIIERLLGEMTPNPRGRRRGTAVVAALSGDLHSLPTTMATAALRDDNWHVEHLGADIPPTELEAFAAATEVHLVVISVTTADSDLVDATTRLLTDGLGIRTIVGRPGATLTELRGAARQAMAARD